MVPNTNNHQSVLQSALASNRLGPKVAKNRRKVPKSSQIGQKSSTKGLEIGQKVQLRQQTVDVHEGKEAEMSKEKKSKKKKKHLKENENVPEVKIEKNLSVSKNGKKKKIKPDISSVKSFNGASLDKIKGYGY